MRSTTFHVSGVAVSAYPWLPVVDHHIPNFEVSFHALKTGTGDITYSVQGTLSNMETGGVSAQTVSAQEFDIVSAITGTRFGNFTFPCAAIRINATTVSGNGNLDMLVMQAGN